MSISLYYYANKNKNYAILNVLSVQNQLEIDTLLAILYLFFKKILFKDKLSKPELIKINATLRILCYFYLVLSQIVQ